MSALRVRTGVDLVDCRKFQRLLDAEPSFLNIAFTAAELATCAGDVQRLSARWAVKEATMKALGSGIGKISPNHIEILNDSTGAPSLNLLASALECSRNIGASDWQITLSHESDFAVAFVIAVIGGESV